MKTNRWRGRAGQSLVEMAMVLPVLAFLTFGLLDFGRAYYFQVSVTNSAREGARVGILNIYTGPQNPSCSISNSYATCPVQTDANIVTAASKELIYSGIAPQSITICPPPDSVVVNATLAKIGGGGIVLTEDTCLSNPTPCTSPSLPSTPNTGFIWISPNRTTGNHNVTVRVTYLFAPMTGMISNLTGAQFVMTAGSSMRSEY